MSSYIDEIIGIEKQQKRIHDILVVIERDHWKPTFLRNLRYLIETTQPGASMLSGPWYIFEEALSGYAEGRPGSIQKIALMDPRAFGVENIFNLVVNAARITHQAEPTMPKSARRVKQSRGIFWLDDT